MPSSSRSSSIPVSFDRFRIRTIQFFSPFRNPQCEIRVQQSPERSWVRKTQIHPTTVNPSESRQIDHYNAAHLFHVNDKSSKPKKSSPHHFNTQSTSNIAAKLSSSKEDISRHTSPPTPCMIRYRQTSLPIHIEKPPKPFHNSIKKSHSNLFRH